jgi:hypothetical protein
MVWLEVVGWAGSAVLVWSLLQERILRLRALNLVGGIVLTVYNGVLGVWPMVGLNVVLSVINVVHLRRLLRTRHDTATYDAVPVDPAGGLVGHLIATHGEDIRRYNPGFDPAAVEGRCGFLVLHEDEMVGLVLARDAGGGTAQVELDYVTPRFRDFSPGEFVYRRSGLFGDRGFRRVVSPPGMVSPYYAELGFHQEGPAYVLDLEPTG